MNDLVHPVEFLFICTEFPTDLPEIGEFRLGIQRKKEVSEDQPVGAGDREFRFAVKVILPEGDGLPAYKGDVIQGKRGEQFIYLCWGTRSEGQWVSHSRIKVPVGSIPTDLLERAVKESRQLQAVIKMTNERGKTVAATLHKDYLVWSIPA